MIIEGKVWKFGDDINTDLLQPSEALFAPVAEQPRYCMSANRPGWADMVALGDVMVAGRNFGTGSSRPAARVMKELGLGCLLADSINGLFFPAIEVPGISEAFKEGDLATIDFEAARVSNARTGEELQGITWPAELIAILNAGGLNAQLIAEGLIAPPAG
jgi:3-isopropylmalate/(R)-2-methylmalate dehydratase small subunit